jgi:hypothetical protein
MSSPTPLRSPAFQTELMEIPRTEPQLREMTFETQASRDRHAIRTLLLQKLNRNSSSPE